MKKKIGIILILVVVIVTGVYVYLKYSVLKAKDFKPVVSKEKSIIDLRPSIIAKLQQLVKDGSNGLYILSIEKINPDVIASKVDVINASIHVDSAALLRLGNLKQLPDDIFEMHFDSLHIDGIGIEDFLNKNQVDIKSIFISRPVIKAYHQALSYNKAKREIKDTMSLYQRIKGSMNKIAIRNIAIDNGTFTSYDVARNKKLTKFDNISIRINNVLIDSSTEFDNSRFLFAKNATINAKNYIVPTPDSLYYFKTAAISISAEQHKITLLDVELNPRGNKSVFESKLRFRKDMYHIAFPKIILYDVNWWALMNREKLTAGKIEIEGGSFTTFLDRSLPLRNSIHIDNYPHQALMKLSFPVSINAIKLNHVNISYEEYNPDAKAGATAFFDNVNGQINYASNMPSEIKKHPIAKFSGSCLFMKKVPMKAAFSFNLSKYKTGEFSADVLMDTLDNSTINPLAEPLGLFSVNSGVMEKASAHIEGNNFKVSGKLSLWYSGLHIVPLKKANEDGQLKKKTVTNIIANIIFIKNSNPLKGKKLREPDFTVERDHHGNFFNIIWVGILTGILKSIGIPVKLVIH